MAASCQLPPGRWHVGIQTLWQCGRGRGQQGTTQVLCPACVLQAVAKEKAQANLKTVSAHPFGAQTYARLATICVLIYGLK